MAKKLPSVAAEPKAKGVTKISISVPIIEQPTGYHVETWQGALSQGRGYRVDVKRFTAFQSMGLERLLHGLKSDNTVLEDGTTIKYHQHALRWLMEQIAAQ